MKWILIVVLIVVLLYFLAKSGNQKFWKLVNKYPLEAYNFFMDNDCWFVIHNGESIDKPSTGEWTGPFFVIIPTIGRIKIYGKTGFFEVKQKEFIRQFE